MTLAPMIAPEIRGVKGKAPAIHGWCVVPGCISRSQHGHHMWPRSYLVGQPQDWVRLPSGAVVANKVGLCVAHHGDVTEHRSCIRLEAGDVFVWFDRAEGQWIASGPLAPQPYIEQRKGDSVAEAVEAVHPHRDLNPGETCDSCGYTKPEKRAAGPRRPSATWTVNVPEDAEIGADVLDEWTEQFAVLMGLDPEAKRLVRYHVLAVVMAWAMQHREAFIADMVESRQA